MLSSNPFRRSPAEPELRTRGFAGASAALIMVLVAAAAGAAEIDVRSIQAATPGASGTAAPAVALRFGSATMTIAQQTELFVDFSNPNPTPAVLSAATVVQLPLELQIKGESVTNCRAYFSTTITPSSITFFGGSTIPPATTCRFLFPGVSPRETGSYTLTVPAGGLQTDLGSNADPASATLTVTGTGLSVEQVFDPPSVAVGASSRLTVTLRNDGALPASFSQPFTGFLPSQLETAAAPNAATTCSGGTASATRDTVVLSAGASLPAGAACTLAVDVASPLPGSYTSQVAAGAMQTTAGTNALASTATLTIAPGSGSAPLVALAPAAFSLSTPANRSVSASLSIANASGSNPLIYRVEPREAARVAWTPRVLGSPVDFRLDDGSIEGIVGRTGGNRSFGSVWLNRFTVAEAMTIDSISVFWPAALPGGGQSSGLQLGMQPNLLVYYDAAASGSPVNAVRIGVDRRVSIGALDAFETYPAQFAVPGAGDVYIGFVDEWAVRVGGYPGVVVPAARDVTQPQQRSWVSGTSSPNVLTDLVNLASNGFTASSEAMGIPGNWMIRATGSTGASATVCNGPATQWLSATPASGWLNGGGSTAIEIVADPAAASLAEGTYQANLCVSSNDAQQSQTPVPVTLTVTPATCVVKDTVFCDGLDVAAEAKGVHRAN